MDGVTRGFTSGTFYPASGRIWSYDGNKNFGVLLGFDASRSSSIYGESNTVRPPSVKVRIYTYYQ